MTAPRIQSRKKLTDGVYKFNVGLAMVTGLLFIMSFLSSQEEENYFDGDYTTSSKTKPIENILPPAPKYKPSLAEDYIMKHATELGYQHEDRPMLPNVCDLWTNTSSPIFPELTVYREELKEYNTLVNEFQPLDDLRLRLSTDNHEEVCSSVELKEGGLHNIFSESQLSHSNIFGYVEPLLTPLRHPEFCAEGRERLLDLSYLVHDFGHFCRQLKPKSRIVLFDLGASLEFHAKEDSSSQPAVYLTNLYKKFGMPFDHIYAFEITEIPPSRVYESVPRELLSAYHWINIPVNPDPSSKTHPFEMILDNFNSDDFIVVKLDIDTPSVEMQLANQLLTTKYSHIVDQFYFEHHVLMQPMARIWGKQVAGTTLNSLQLFQSMREKGIGSHSWV